MDGKKTDDEVVVKAPRRPSSTRDRIRRHVAALVTAAATATLSTTACACDPMPPPATPQIDVQNLEVQAVWIDAGGPVLEVTIKTLGGQPPLVFDETLADPTGGMVVSAKGGETLTLRVRPNAGVASMTGTIQLASASKRVRAKLEITPGAQPAIGTAVRAWLTALPDRE